jgi:outer membrane protein TolC
VSTFVSAFLLLLVAFPPMVLAQERPASSPDAGAPVLSLDEAISVALQSNRLVKNAVLEAEKQDFRVSAARTRRLPLFQVGALGGQLLHAFDFTFPAGAFGTYPETGPIPSTEAKVNTPSQFTVFMTGNIDFPLLNQYKIGLGIRATELGRDIVREGVRSERQKIAADVRAAYFNLVASQAAVDAARQAVRTLEEAQRLTARYVVEETVLRAEALDVDARLAKSVYDLSVAENGLSTQSEHFNELLGRDLSTVFRVQPMLEDELGGLTLAAARQQALQNRPEIRQARLKEKQAEFDRRLAKAEYIPDVNLSLRYLGFQNFNVLPTSVTTAGVFVTWEPFDWGRRGDNIAEKARTVIQAKNGAAETEAQIAVEVGMKYRKWQEASLLLKATRTGQAAAVEQLRVTTDKYAVEAVLIRDVLQGQSRSSDAGFQYQQALSSYWTALAELYRALGDE